MQGTEKHEPKLLTVTSPNHTLTQTYGGSRTPGVVENEGRLSSILASPRAIMVLVPLIVLGLGAALTIIGQIALGSASRTMAKNRFVSHTTSLTRGLEETLGQAEPLLDELARIAISAEALRQPKAAPTSQNHKRPKDAQHTKDAKDVLRHYEHEELTPVALEMRDLLIGRPGITQAYIAFPDGTFLSADPAGTRSVGIQVTQGGQSASYQVQGQKVRLISTQKSKFNPKARDWYKLAEEKQERVWSAPYTFFFNQHTGVTRSHPIYKDEKKSILAAVVGVDFDVDALTAFMAGSESGEEQVHSVVFTLGGVVLAYPRGAKKLATLQAMKRVPTHEAIGDPVLSALIRRIQKGAGGHRFFDFTLNKNTMLASARKVEGGPGFYVATFSPERSVLKELYEHRKKSLWIGSLSLFVAVGLAWLLARRLYLIRRAAHLAQVAAREAQGQVRDLGSYRLVERIGEGGMGEVWRATHRLLARQAAIKLIKSSHASTERKAEQRERFRREAQAIAGLRSRNTIALYDYGVTPGGTLFYVMELLEGIDLNSLVAGHGPQSPERVRRILIQACNSLGEAHRAQLVHRDVKPANLFLCREASEVEIVKVLDFGLVFQADSMEDAVDRWKPSSSLRKRTASRLLLAEAPATSAANRTPHTETIPTAVDEGRITRADHQLGTPAFMSPEQALGNGTDGRSDIYSLACVAWWLLCGKVPFHADTAVTLMLKHIEDPPPKLEDECERELSRGFKNLILSCLAKSPLGRPQSAEELGAALRALGPQADDWSDEIAQEWWQDNVARVDTPPRNFSLPPLRDAEVIPPEAI